MSEEPSEEKRNPFRKKERRLVRKWQGANYVAFRHGRKEEKETAVRKIKKGNGLRIPARKKERGSKKRKPLQSTETI